jgi:hypothetical protein
MQIAITAVEFRHGCAPCISGCFGTGNSTGPLLGWQRPQPSYTGTLPIAPFFLRSDQPRRNSGEIGNPAPTRSGCVSGGSPPPIRRMVPAERTRKRLVSRITGVGTGRPFPARRTVAQYPYLALPWDAVFQCRAGFPAPLFRSRRIPIPPQSEVGNPSNVQTHRPRKAES